MLLSQCAKHQIFYKQGTFIIFTALKPGESKLKELGLDVGSGVS